MSLLAFLRDLAHAAGLWCHTPHCKLDKGCGRVTDIERHYRTRHGEAS